MTSAFQVIAQGFIAVMLSFWGTVVFTEHYYVKLIAVVALLALVAAFGVIVAIFKKPDDKLEVEGELLTRAASPALWSRVDGLCKKLHTRPCDNIVGGIDDNFFVTEHPVHLNGRVLHGRTLFVSLSLLKRLGGSTIPARQADNRALPIDLSFGDGEPILPVAEPLSLARMHLEQVLPGLVEDARRAVQLLRRSEHLDG